jgi:hypothetical protein
MLVVERGVDGLDYMQEIISTIENDAASVRKPAFMSLDQHAVGIYQFLDVICFDELCLWPL